MGSAPTDAEPAVILVKAYDHVLWSVQKAEKFPRSFRFSVGERIVQASIGLRYLFRLARDLHLVSKDAWEFSAEKIDEIGRMTGGWQKAGRKA